MTELSLRVVKLGGSLLDEPKWVTHFRRWLALQSPAVNVIVVGGGALVEQVRAVDRTHSLSAAAAHWLAEDAMSLTAAITAELVREARLVQSVDELQNSFAAPQILDVRDFLRGQQDAHDALPCSWDVTSDSIAARVASSLRACELVLLKSTLPAEPVQFEPLACCGYVDHYFPRAALGQTVRLVNLRDAQFSEVRPKPAFVGS